jgi:hypothetical protein
VGHVAHRYSAGGQQTEKAALSVREAAATILVGSVACDGGPSTGTTNFEMISFEYLDEINIAARGEAFAFELQTQHDADLARSVEVTPSWHRSVWEKELAWTVWTLAGQRWAVGLRHRLRG